jgi:hypothetical protein
MEITQQEYSLLKELVREFDYPDVDPKRHVTSEMLAVELGITKRGALERLERERAEGNLKREKVRIENNHIAWGYYRDNV